MLKQILEETDFDLLRNDLNLIPPKSWTNMNMLEMFSERYHFNEASTTKSKLKSTLCSFWNEKAADTNAANSAKRRAMALHTTVGLVIDSRPALSLINSNIRKQSKMMLKDSLVQDAYDEMLEAGTSQNENNSNGEEQQPEPKKRKYLKPSDFKDVGWGDKVTMLNEHFGANGVLDLTRISIIPKRLRTAVDGICQHYHLSLPMTLKNEEYNVLNIISNCRTKEYLYKSVDNIDPFCNNSELPYIKLAVHKLCNLWHRNVLSGHHNEDWYRVNVYGDLFDFIFNGQAGYETRRSECHSSIVKSLKKMGLLNEKTKDVRLDFIFTNSSGLNDAFYCEDKPYERLSKDYKKTKHLREQALNYWESLLPYKECIEHITAVTCQFNKLTLHIAATKFIAGVTVSSVLREVRIPNNDQEGASVADYLATVISLVRMIIRNFEIIKLMTDIAKKDNLAFLSHSLTPDICYRDDSPHSSQTSSSSSSSSEEWSTQERKARIMQKIDDAIATFDDHAEYLDCSWENIAFSPNN